MKTKYILSAAIFVAVILITALFVSCGKKETAGEPQNPINAVGSETFQDGEVGVTTNLGEGSTVTLDDGEPLVLGADDTDNLSVDVNILDVGVDGQSATSTTDIHHFLETLESAIGEFKDSRQLGND
ncbi:MAG: hypothetical protein FWG87_10220 [Defluviitaleaceae bacterium]|nr:hypothetical protein [Defluviitaleaceae bacterium]